MHTRMAIFADATDVLEGGSAEPSFRAASRGFSNAHTGGVGSTAGSGGGLCNGGKHTFAAVL